MRRHGEGSIWERKDGRHVAAVSLPNGRRRVRYARSEKAAKAALADLLRELDAGVVASRDPTLGDYLARWLRDGAGPRVAPKTLTRYAEIVNLHLVPALGRRRLSRLSADDVAGYLAAKAREQSPQTVAHHRAVLRTALNQARRWGLVGRNVAELTDPPRLPRVERQVLTVEQARLLLSHSKDERLHALWVLALTTGMREAELLGLAWEDTDLARGTVRVSHTLHRIEGEWVRLAPKTERSRRTIALTDLARAALEEHRRRMARERTPDWPYWGLVFTTTRGWPLHANVVLSEWYRALDRLGLPRVRFHDLRRGAATFLVAEGVHPRVVMALLGHSTVRMAMDLYAHTSAEETREAARKIEEALG